MRCYGSILIIKVLVIQCLTIACVSRDFDFYYFVQQWPASYCDTKRSCCYPKTGKPAEDFSIHGLWPNYKDGTYPSNCDTLDSFDHSQISDLGSRLKQDWPSLACPSSDGLRFWGHEWDKHGTCSSEPLVDQHAYFKAALDLKNKANLLQALDNAGIKPANGKYYSLESIKEAIKESTGYTPFIECNVDSSRNPQLYQVYMCVGKSGSEFIKCPVFPHGRPCASQIQFPSFSETTNSHDQEL